MSSVYLLAAIILAIGILLPLLPLTTGLTLNQTKVTVYVDPVTQIRVLPTLVQFSGYPGDDVSSANSTLTIENVGSNRIDYYYVYASTVKDETTNPLGQNNPSLYSAATTIVIANQTHDTLYWYVGHQEWNWTESIELMDCSGILGAGDRIMAWGFITNTTHDYLWCVRNGTAVTNPNPCVGGAIGISSMEDDGTSEARTIDLTETITLSSAITAHDQTWGVGFINIANHPFQNYYVAVRGDCTTVYLFKFDKEFTGYGIYLGGTLNPGDRDYAYLRAWIPYGIPTGDLNPGILTFVAA